MSTPYIDAVLDSTPGSWHAYRRIPTRGLEHGILEAQRGFPATLSILPRHRFVSVAVLAADRVDCHALPSDLLFRVQAASRLTRLLPDPESGRLWVQAASLLPLCDELALAIEHMFKDVTRTLRDDRLQTLTVET